MNKRINYLANEARIEVSQRIGYNDRDRENAFEEVFAELIVRECADTVLGFHNQFGDSAHNEIREHFGVKE